MRMCPVCGDGKTSGIWKTVVACLKCGMVYDCEPVPFDYSRVENYALAEPDPARTLRTTEILTPYVGSKALEVGCGQGELLEALSKLSDATGIDPSIANVEVCRKRGLSVLNEGVTDDGLVGSFDLVVMSHVLEHLPDVPRALQQVTRLVRKTGFVYVEVPDATRHLDHLTIPFQEFSAEHINHFSPTLLVAALQRSGFWVESFGTRSIAQPGGFYPAMWAIASVGLELKLETCDLVLPVLMNRYAVESLKKLQVMADQVNEELDGVRPIVWGAGVLADHLLPYLLFPPVQVVDRDKGKWNKKIMGCCVGSPAAIQNDHTIFVCSIIGKESILRDIKSRGLTNRIVTI